MRTTSNRWKLLLAGVGLTAMVGIQTGKAVAEDLSDTIVKALTPSLTRSLSKGPPGLSASDEAFINSLKTQKTRSLSVTSDADRAKIDTIVADKKSIDLAVEFDYGSSTLRGEALKVADALGKALGSSGLNGQTFLIMGHTDAKGSDETNLKLSERRAWAVRDHLVAKYGVKPENLVPVGYGKTRLLKPDAPFAPENRRVQTVNILAYKSAGQ